MSENKFFDQGAVLLHGGEDGAGENIILLCAPVATESTPWLPGVGILFPRGFLHFWSLLNEIMQLRKIHTGRRDTSLFHVYFLCAVLNMMLFL